MSCCLHPGGHVGAVVIAGVPLPRMVGGTGLPATPCILAFKTAKIQHFKIGEVYVLARGYLALIENHATVLTKLCIMSEIKYNP